MPKKTKAKYNLTDTEITPINHNEKYDKHNNNNNNNNNNNIHI